MVVIISAVIIGLATAYYFGLRPGAIAAGISVGAFLLAFVMPGKALAIYGLVAVGFIGVLVAGPRYGRPGAKANLLGAGRRLLGKLLRWRRR